MTGRLTFSFRDYEGDVSTTSFLFPLTLSVPQVIARAQLAAPLYQAISNASLFEASFQVPVPLPAPSPPAVESNCYDRLIVLCRNEQRYGSITLPSPSGLSYLSTGPHRGYKVDLANAQSFAALETLRALLALQLLPDGNIFPTQEIQAALMVTE